VRYDAAAAKAGTSRLREFPALWRYARDLYAIGAFTRTTDFSAFGGESVADDWKTPVAAAADGS
jgi:putative glutathione S-transferase